MQHCLKMKTSCPSNQRCGASGAINRRACRLCSTATNISQGCASLGLQIGQVQSGLVAALGRILNGSWHISNCGATWRPLSRTVVQQEGKMYSMNNRRTYCWRKHVQKVTFDSSDSFSVLTGSNNGKRRFIEKVIRVHEMDSMGTASKNLSREV